MPNIGASFSTGEPEHHLLRLIYVTRDALCMPVGCGSTLLCMAKLGYTKGRQIALTRATRSVSCVDDEQIFLLMTESAVDVE